jgi:uncharacterized protein (TIGR02145 family)
MKNRFLILLVVILFNLTSYAQKTVVIGTQTWTAENLNVITFQNGDTIPEAKSAEEWVIACKNKKPAWCYYNNDSINGLEYGKLYNWYAIDDPRGLAPLGWLIPNEEEWKVLIKELGGEKRAVEKLKSTNLWGKTGNNTSGMNAKPAGYRGNSGLFEFMGSDGIWWSASVSGENYAIDLSLSDLLEKVSLTPSYKSCGYSVRCLKK